MPLLLNIDTATENAIVSIAEGDHVLAYSISLSQRDHASFLQPAVKELLLQTGNKISRLDAVAVSAGPGSYTGLRVGMASAKGLCYSLKIPLITLSTLEIIARSIVNHINDPEAFYCAAIDARRMEIFTAVYDFQLQEIIKPCALAVDLESFRSIETKMYISGSGAKKVTETVHNKNIMHDTVEPSPAAMAELSWLNFSKTEFADIAYAAPFYLKDFYTPGTAGKTK